jgi:hypothetical protein
MKLVAFLKAPLVKRWKSIRYGGGSSSSDPFTISRPREEMNYGRNPLWHSARNAGALSSSIGEQLLPKEARPCARL